MVTLLWILFDVAICVRMQGMTGPFSNTEVLIWGAIGLALGGVAWVTEHHERKDQDREIGELKNQLTQLTAFHQGVATTLGGMSLRTLELAEDQAQRMGNLDLQHQLAELKSELEKVKKRPPWGAWASRASMSPQQRMLTAEQYNAIRDVLLTVPAEYQCGIPIRLPYNDPEAEKYAEYFTNLLGFAGHSPDAKITSDLHGVIIRVRNKTAPPPLAVHFSKALQKAGIKHRVDVLDLQFEIAEKYPCELVIARNA